MTAPAPGVAGSQRDALAPDAASPGGIARPAPAGRQLRDLLPRQVRPAALALAWACLAVAVGVLAWIAVLIGTRL